MAEKPYQVYTVAVKNENIKELQSYMAKMQLFVCVGRNVPAHIMRKIISLLSTPDVQEDEIYSKEIKEISRKADGYFAPNKDYNFNGIYATTQGFIFRFSPPQKENETLEQYQRRIKKLYSKKTYQPYSLEKMCSASLQAFFDKEPRVENKGVGIRFFYKQIENYSKIFSKQHQNDLTHYRMTVISTFLANEVGLIKPYIENPTNPLLNDKGKDDTKALNLKKKPR